MSKTKTKVRRKLALWNWPPSRGRMPAWMRKKPKYKIPPVTIEAVEWVPDKKCWKRPVKAIKRIRAKRAPKRKKSQRRGTYIRDIIARHDAQREVYLRLNQHVATMATLKPEQWGLIGGAEFHESRTAPSRLKVTIGRRGKRRKAGKLTRIKAYANLETMLPTRAITVDLIYPLDKIARVTILPYTHVGRRGPKYAREYMSVGYFLWQLAGAYKAIYKRHRFWGVWGHVITDLHFEQLHLVDNVGDVAIGS